jgi:hypothetical protein
MSDVEGTAGNPSARVMNRRALLRASGVAAGIAGIGGIAAAHAPAAEAAAGDPILMGAYNQAGTAFTGLNADSSGPTLLLSNVGSGAPLRLAEHFNENFSSDSGDLFNVNGDLRWGTGDDNRASVFTSYTASRLIPVIPFRAVDTRTTAGRANIANRTGNLDSAGRLIGGHTIEIDLGDEVFQGTGVFANLTVTQAAASGYLTLWPGGTRPGTSSLNYAAGQVLSNFSVCGLNFVDTMRLYASSTTHVVLDVLAFAAGNWSDVNPALLPTGAASNLARPARKAPAWHASVNG